MYEMMKLLAMAAPVQPVPARLDHFRTPDGKVWPYQTGTNVTTTWFDLIFAQPGAGKSVLMNTLNLGTMFDAGPLQRCPISR
jgi:intracellular multiplication protein IcmB